MIFHTLAVRNTARFTPALFPKERGARHDWEIYRDLALRVTDRLRPKRSLLDRIKLRVRMSVSPTRMIQLLLARGDSGVTLTRLRKKPEGIDLGPLRPDQLPGRLRSRDRTMDLAPSLVLEDLLRLGEVSPPVDGELVLIGRRHKQDCNSWMHNTERLTRGRPRHQLLMHPDDLATRGLADGATVPSPRGSDRSRSTCSRPTT